MRCPSCQAENRVGVRFCEECGAKLELPCPSCGAMGPPARKFCGECGASLAKLPEKSPSESASPPERLAAWERQADERKPATVLFADVTGSTALTEQLDAEDAFELLDGARQRICTAIETNRGTVCRVTGDGVMAVFGAPIASERHAVDACAAAWEMQQAIAQYSGEAKFRSCGELKIRVGLHSGEIVVLSCGDGDKVEYDADGPTVPIAARMEQSARPGETYLTAATRVLAWPRVETETLKPISVKGISEPMRVHRLLRVQSAEEIPLNTARTPFVGRRAELVQFRGLLETCLEEGQGQAIYVRGEPGIGKTRLLEEFTRIAAEHGLSIHRGLVLPFGVGKGRDAIRSLVKSLLGIEPGAGKVERLAAATTALNGGRLAPDQAVPLNDLLDLPQSMEQKAFYDAMDNDTRNKGKRTVVSTLVTTASEWKRSGKAVGTSFPPAS